MKNGLWTTNAKGKTALLTGILFLFIAVVIFFKFSINRYPNFIFTYPWITHDGFEWISDSLHYLDHRILASHRNPALPLTFMLLRTVNAVDYFPWLLAILTLVLFASLYWLAVRFVSALAALAMIFWFFFVFRIHAFIDYVLADQWCVTFVTLGLGCLVRVSERPRFLYGAAIFFGLALNYQFAPGFMSPALIWFVGGHLGIKWCRANRWRLFKAGTLFLAIALPQFIYKWMAFGSPLYSKVFHFPLVRFHLYSLFNYLVVYLAFLGWPLAVLVFTGFWKSRDKRSGEWQLIHLSGTCLFFFWVFCYLWMDPRFLLYLLPCWAVYAAFAIEHFGILSKISLRGKTPFEKILTGALVYFCLAMSANKLGAFDSTALPITPQMVLRFSSTTMSKYNIRLITTDSIHTEYDNEYYSAATAFPFFSHYRRVRWAELDIRFGEDAQTVGKIVRELITGAEAVGVLGDFFANFESRMRLFNTVERNVVKCEPAKVRYCVTATKEWLSPSNWKPVFVGKVLTLLERSP